MYLGGAVDDHASVTAAQIDEYITALAISYAHMRIDRKQLGNILAAWDRKDLERVVQLVAHAYGVPSLMVEVRYSAVLPGESVAAMQPAMGANKHLLLFKDSREALLKRSVSQVLFMAAHEFAHMRLFTDSHELCKSEVATDLLALIMGFDCAYEDIRKSAGLLSRVGYIPRHLVDRALKLVEKRSDVLYMHT